MIVEQIKSYIEAVGTPHLWPGHTHTRPPEGARIEYLDEYDLPITMHKDKRLWAPCPCCSPSRGKYYKGGKIGWFPDEGVIRNMGPDCFAALDKEGHMRALAQLRKEQETQKAITSLLANLPKAPAALKIFEKALPVVQAVDDLRTDLRKQLPLVLKVNLWKHISDGKLLLNNKVFATIAGYKMLDPNEPRLASGLKTAIDTLRNIQPGADHKATIAAMPEADREKTARAIGRSLNRAAEIFREVHDIREFVSTTTIATLRNWGRQEGCPIRIYAMLDNYSLYFGRKEHEQHRFEIAAEFFFELGSVPKMGQSDLAA